MSPATLLWRQLRRHPLLALAAPVLLSLWYAVEVWLLRPDLTYQGLPRTTATTPWTWHRVLRNDGFLVGWSDLRGNPLWVTYRVTDIPDNAPRLPRPGSFRRDWRSLNPLDHDSYTRSGYQRVHLAPNYAISRLYGREAQLQTFLMTNISPQRAGLNQKLWQRLEELEVDHFAPRVGELWVITGPIFEAPRERLSSSLLVEIPDAFYRIWISPGAIPSALAFRVPQGVRGTEPLTRFVTSIDAIEAATGLDFFHALPDDIEAPLEAARSPDTWGLPEVARRAPRY